MNNRVGEKNTMNDGEIAEIVEYINSTNIIVKFKVNSEFFNFNYELVKAEYGQFKKGNIKSHFKASVYGVGIIGIDTIVDKNGKKLDSYDKWIRMISRCYNIEYQNRQPTYKYCIVCYEWLYYPNFKKWYAENYYQIDGERMQLDKDILHKGNKIYSLENCVFVPQSINNLFTKSDAKRGSLPIGVNYDKKSNNYRSQCNIFDINTKKHIRLYLGGYINPTLAFFAYKQEKEKNIITLANYYKDKIPENLYNAMINYKVEITD